MLQADATLVNARHRDGWTPLHAAASALDEAMVAWLLAHGADVSRLGPGDRTPLDLAAAARKWRTPDSATRFAAVAALLRPHGAELTARSAVALGEADWLRARHAEGALANSTVVGIFEPASGLLTIAVKHNRPEMLALLLQFGCDPDERMRLEDLEEPEYSWGMPLWHCAAAGRLAMAEMLLERGADPNARVYASGSPVFSAYREGDAAMIELLQRHGGVTDAITAGIHRQIELATKMLAGEVDGRLQEGMFAGQTLAEQLLWGGADGGHPEIVRLALDRVDWPRDDARWYRMLWRPLPGHAARPDYDRYLTCLRLMLERGDANSRGSFGRTLLHDLAARGTPGEQIAFATVLLDAGARIDVRDDLLRSTPLGWACRWGRVELAKLLLERGADPVEADAEPWATPRAWAEKRDHDDVLAVLQEHRR
jgi:ankyrin repeat protein